MNKLVLSPFFLLGCLSVFSDLAFPQTSYSPYVSRNFPMNLYWGDTHLHTNLSYDAYNTGNKRLGPEEAYRFARGESVTAHNGMLARLSRPLDFLVIADHAEAMGFMQALAASNPDILKSEGGQRLAAQLHEINEIAKTDQKRASKMASTKLYHGGWATAIDVWSQGALQTVWEKVCNIADKYNAPGKFTTLIGYEWLGGTERAAYHRVVIFKEGASTVSKNLPFSAVDSPDPADLWSYLSDYENITGGQALAIPHNGNLSEGDMFALTDHNGNPFSRDYATARNYWEPLLEVTQIKGDGEAHPLLSPNDEFADYETWNSWVGREPDKNLDNAEIEQKKYSYARPALKLGLQQHSKLGVNPFKFGMIGSTDSHTSLSTADEDNYWGKMTKDEPSPDRMTIEALRSESRGWDYTAAGYMAVWATENTREGLFSAMRRKEVYASTGPRIAVRFFGGWQYENDDAYKPDLENIGYRKGVPMGGDLTHAPLDKTPSFLIQAVKDPESANLDRVQIIKGWHDKNGELHEKVYDVAISDKRKPNWRGKIHSVGNTVNIKQATYTNTIGAAELSTVWKDPDFDENELAFYYVRVLEIPTPRWTAYDANFFKIKNVPEKMAMITQERAYTSPIWYTPMGR